MKKYKRLCAAAALLWLLIALLANGGANGPVSGGRPYRVEISRLANQMRQEGSEMPDLSEAEYVTGIARYDGSPDFYQADSDYRIEQIGAELYRFDYHVAAVQPSGGSVWRRNAVLAASAALTVGLLLYIGRNILLPFARMSELPYELAKGNLTVPLKENRNRYFGKFLWGMDLLRENMEQQKQRELEMQKGKKTMLLSLSHDLKTPLSAIKLYAQALSHGLYTNEEKRRQVAESINAKADEIEGYVSQIVRSADGDFLQMEVHNREFFLSEPMEKIREYYSEKLVLNHTEFAFPAYRDCLLKGDPDRCEEVLQNLMENALKYGDGQRIALSVSQEDEWIQITVTNSGCTLPETELPHIFDTFWRGSNAEGCKGSGLGLSICRRLMNDMGGEIFARIQNGEMSVTTVFSKA